MLTIACIVTKYMGKIKFLFTISVITVLIGLLIPGNRIVASSSFKYKDYAAGKTFKYSGTVPSYYIDGVKADLSLEPALINDRNIAFASAYGLFRDAIGVQTKYVKSKKRVSFKYLGHTLLMYVGENRAELDGVEIEAPCAPVRIKYKKSKKIATMVPARFVAESLGMKYDWDSESSSVNITIPFSYILNGEQVLYTGTRGKITLDGENVRQYGGFSIIRSDTALISTETDLFEMANIAFHFDEDSGIIELRYGSDKILYCVGSRIAYVNGLLEHCDHEPALLYLSNLNKEILYIPGRFTMENLGFGYEWDSDTGTSKITVINPIPERGDVYEFEDEESGSADNDPLAESKKSGDVISIEEAKSTNNSLDEEGIEDSALDDMGISTDPDGEADVTGFDDGGIISDSEGENDDSKSDDTGIDSDSEGAVDGTGIQDDDLIPEFDVEEYLFNEKSGLLRVINTVKGYKFFTDKENCSQTLNLPVPKKIKTDNIVVRDDVLGCQTELVIKGDYSSFYKTAKIENSGEAVLQIQIYYDSENDETVIKLLSDILIGCSINESKKGYVSVEIDFIKNIFDKIIVIDAGHGDHDPGAQHKGIKEKNLNLKILLNCKKLFDRSEVKVYYTRTDDSFLSLYDRAAFAGLTGADMFIAIHHNYSEYSSVKGTSVYYSTKDTYTSLNGLTSKELAERMLDSLTDALGTRVFSTGVIAENFVVVRDSEAPAVLIEIGFMSNSDELSRLVDDEFSEKAAKAIYNTVMKIYEEADEVKEDGEQDLSSAKEY